MTIFVCVIASIAGFAVGWFAKDPLSMAFTGTKEFVLKLEAKTAALKAAMK